MNRRLPRGIGLEVAARGRVVGPKPVVVEAALGVEVLAGKPDGEGHGLAVAVHVAVHVRPAEGLVGGPPDGLARGVREQPGAAQAVGVDVAHGAALHHLDGHQAAHVVVAHGARAGVVELGHEPPAVPDEPRGLARHRLADPAAEGIVGVGGRDAPLGVAPQAAADVVGEARAVASAHHVAVGVVGVGEARARQHAVVRVVVVGRGVRGVLAVASAVVGELLRRGEARRRGMRRAHQAAHRVVVEGVHAVGGHLLDQSLEGVVLVPPTAALG